MGNSHQLLFLKGGNMLNYEQMLEISNDIESMLVSHCERLMDGSSATNQMFDDIQKAIFDRWSHVANQNEIVYIVRDIVSRHMHNPLSSIFRYVCYVGIGFEFITSNVSVIPREEYIMFCMNNREYTNKFGFEFGITKVIQELLELYYDTREITFFKQSEHIFQTIKNLFKIISSTIEFKSRDESGIYFAVDEIVRHQFNDGMYTDDGIYIDPDGEQTMTPYYCIENIGKIITSVLVYGDLDVDVDAGISGLVRTVCKDKTLNNISTLADIIKIVELYILTYNEQIYFQTPDHTQINMSSEEVSIKAADIVNSIIEVCRDILLDTIDSICSNDSYTRIHDDDVNSVLYNLYACIYDNLILYRARGDV